MRRSTSSRHRTSPSTSWTRQARPRQDRRGHHRLPLDHRGRPHLLDRPEVPGQLDDPRSVRATALPLPVESLGYNFHTANMPVVAQGCVGPGLVRTGPDLRAATPPVCDIGNGACRTDADHRRLKLQPSAVHLDPNKRYFISILPGDGVNPTIGGAGGPDDRRQARSASPRPAAPTPAPTGAWEPAGARCDVRPRHGRRADRRPVQTVGQYQPAADPAADGEDSRCSCSRTTTR